MSVRRRRGEEHVYITFVRRRHGEEQVYITFVRRLRPEGHCTMPVRPRRRPTSLCVDALAIVALLALAACGGSGGESSAASEWVSETVAEGDITTVRTISGSVWGGTATLEEQASIGVEAGEDAYALGSVRAIAELDGEIFVLDQQIPVVRVYELTGQHLRELGAEGSGPGELQRPESMVLGGDSRLYIRDARNGRIMILSKQGAELGTIRVTSSFNTSNPMVMTRDGTLYKYELLNQAPT